MNGTYEFQFQGENLVADADAALIWPERELLVVADLHFEKRFGLWGDGDVSPAV